MAGAGSGPAASPQAEPGANPDNDSRSAGFLLPYCSGSTTGSERVSMATARARGFDVDAILSGLEGVFEADVRWDQPFTDPQTHARVELASDGAGTITGWDCRSGPRPSCYAGNILSLDVRVSISTSDGRLAGSFVGSLSPLDGTIVHSELKGAPSIFAGTDLAAVLGTLALGPLGSTQTARAEVIIQPMPKQAPRIQLRVVIVDDDKGPVRELYAWPVDGCEAWATFLAQGEPLTAFAPPGGHCTSAHFAPGSCCSATSELPSPPNATMTDLSCAARASK